MPGPKKQAEPFPFAYRKVRDPKTGDYSYERLVSPQIPDYILSTGNPAVLQAFYQQHAATLTAADRKYLNARIHTANKIEKLRASNIRKIAQNRVPEKPQITTKKGFTGINVKYDGPQTSSNGCWSSGMSLLLKTRGVDLSPEEIRAWRPNFEPGQEQNMSAESRRGMDYDGLGKVYENADLIQEVLPNTAVSSATINPLPENFQLTNAPARPNIPNMDFMTEDEIKALPEMQEYNRIAGRQIENARKVYKQEMKKQLGTLIRNALEKDKSPIVMNVGGNHFVTITGISKHGNRLRIEDSFRSLDKTTQIKTLDDLIEQHLISRPAKTAPGITLTWLKDLPVPSVEERQVPENENEQPEMIKIHENPMRQNPAPQPLNPANAAPAANAPQNAQDEAYKGACSINPRDGSVTLSEPGGTLIGKREDTAPNIGQLRGQEISEPILINQAPMSEKLNGGRIYANTEDDAIYGQNKLWFGSVQTYYPKKVYFKGDPELMKNYIDADMKARSEMEKKLSDRVRQDMRKAKPQNHTFGSFIYDMQDELYKQSGDTVYHIARIYAANIVLNQKENVQGDRLLQPIGEEELTAIDELATKMTPSIRGMLEEKTGKIDLPLLAVKEDPTELILKIDDFAEKCKNAANQDLVQRKSAIDDAYAAMDATGTGRNYIGIRRNRNNDEYSEMMDDLRNYKDALGRGEDPDGPTCYNLTQKCLKYIDNKKQVRRTTDGQIRFDNTMRVLKQIMPADKFRVLCNQINRARDVAKEPKNENFVTPETYAPMTLNKYVQEQMKGVDGLGRSDVKKRFSNIIAAREIARTRRADDPSKAIVVNPSQKRQEEAAIKARAAQIRSEVGFQNFVRSFCTEPYKELKIQTYQNSDGAQLENAYGYYKQGYQEPQDVGPHLW